MTYTQSALQLHSHRTTAAARDGFRSVVSLHSHSSHSREKLVFIPVIARQVPVFNRYFERSLAKYRRIHGQPLDFSTLSWRPPLTPAEVVLSERVQAQERFDLDALVSLTDHDTLDGPMALREAGHTDVPLSFEWSVPYRGSMFHLGLHAVASSALDTLVPQLADYTDTGHGSIPDLLDALCACRETIVVLNHPYWDLSGIGRLRHDANVVSFLRRHGAWIHGLELNGYRTWTENRRVLPLADGFALPLVGGGDRHGYAANAIVNLSRASTFAEFAEELREGRTSHSVVLPAYEQPFLTRVLETTCDILRPDARGHRLRWQDRVFVQVNGRERPLTDLWDSPAWVDACVAIVRTLGSTVLRPVLGRAHGDGLALLAPDCCPDRGFASSVRPAAAQPPVAA